MSCSGVKSEDGIALSLPIHYTIEIICAVLCDSLMKFKCKAERVCGARARSYHHLGCLLNSASVFNCNNGVIRLWGGIKSSACLACVSSPFSLYLEVQTCEAVCCHGYRLKLEQPISKLYTLRLVYSVQSQLITWHAGIKSCIRDFSIYSHIRYSL